MAVTTGKCLLLALVVMSGWCCACGAPGPAGDLAVRLLWQANPAAATRGELSGLVTSVGITVRSGNDLLAQASCDYESYRCVVDAVAAGGNRTVTAEAFAADSKLLYRGQTSGVEVKKDQLQEVAVVMQPAYAQDIYAPAAIDDLSGQLQGADVMLSWTAVGDDVRAGQADEYQLRWDTVELNEDSFTAANQVEAPSPRAAGQAEAAPIRGLPAGGTYWFAIKVIDDAGNISPLSNVVSVTLP